MTKKTIGIVLIVVAAIVALLQFRKKSDTPAADKPDDDGKPDAVSPDSTPDVNPHEIIDKCVTIPVGIEAFSRIVNMQLNHIPTQYANYTAIKKYIYEQPNEYKRSFALAKFFKAHDVKMSRNGLMILGPERLDAWLKSYYSGLIIDKIEKGFLKCK